MSTLEEIYQQITGDDGQKAAFADAAQTEETLAKFLASLGCDATPEEVSAFLKAKAGAEGELADEELDDVAGGCNLMEGALSFMTAGIYCAATAIASAAGSGHKGTDGQILCSDIDLTTRI